jgi:hypothetical protein
MEEKKKATALLREYDTLRARMRVLERETQKAVTSYGIASGIWGLTADKFRLQLQMEKEQKERKNAKTA